MKAYKWIALILPVALSGCIIANVESGRAYNGIDSEYTSSMNTEITASCIKMLGKTVMFTWKLLKVVSSSETPGI